MKKSKILLIIFISKLTLQNLNYDKEVGSDTLCNKNIAQTYGFEGKTYSSSYSAIREKLKNDYCPNMKQTCCSPHDFEIAKIEWRERSENIKKYVNNVFRAIQKISVLQTSILVFANEINNKKTDKCQSIDYTFFNTPLDIQSLYPYIEHGLETFTFLQKGFYCMVCDTENQKFFGADNNNKLVIVMNNEMCNDLIFYFREFIIYKVNYIDPLISNLNKIFNCIDDGDFYPEENQYDVSLENINSCLNKGENCEYVCKEYTFGSANNLFLGKLANYLKTIDKLMRLSKNFLNNKKLEINNPSEDDMKFDIKNLDDKFFVVEEKNQFLLSQMKIVIKENGINLFEISRNSNFNLENEFKQNSKNEFDNIIKFNKDEINPEIKVIVKDMDFTQDNSKILKNEENKVEEENLELLENQKKDSNENEIIHNKEVEENDFENKFDKENEINGGVPDELEMKKLNEEMLLEENEEDQKLKQLANEDINNRVKPEKKGFLGELFEFISVLNIVFVTLSILIIY